ncbi:MAG: hypothetical protein DME26_05320 [Verrucomicrobia bacterium]|nr:MAG: hypothetical protein DME26_05320 [Verrucomicrobiota bacterium]
MDLGEAAPINEAVELVCKRMSAGQYAAKDLSPAMQRLSQLVYAPLAPYLTNVSHLIFCPDGQWSRLPFEMLSVGNRFLIEEKTISYVTSGREVVRLQSRAGVSPAQKEKPPADPDRRDALSYVRGKSLVMGNPDFDLDLKRTNPPLAPPKEGNQISNPPPTPPQEGSKLASATRHFPSWEGSGVGSAGLRSLARVAIIVV